MLLDMESSIFALQLSEVCDLDARGNDAAQHSGSMA